MEQVEILVSEKLLQPTSSMWLEQEHSTVSGYHQVQLLDMSSPLMPLEMPPGNQLEVVQSQMPQQQGIPSVGQELAGQTAMLEISS